MNDIITQLEWRYATKQFDKTKKLTPELWEKLEKSLVLSPSSFGIQPWKFVVITANELRESLVKHSWNQAQVTDCSHFVVFMAREEVDQADIERFLDSIVEQRGGDRASLQGYEDMMVGFTSQMDAPAKFAWAKNQVYIALGQLMVAAAALEIDTCPMEGINPAEYDKALNIDGYKTIVACAVGYRCSEDKYADAPKVRYSAEDIVIKID